MMDSSDKSEAIVMSMMILAVVAVFVLPIYFASKAAPQQETEVAQINVSCPAKCPIQFSLYNTETKRCYSESYWCENAGKDPKSCIYCNSGIDAKYKGILPVE